MTYTMVLTEIRGRVGLVTLNRPQSMNAFNTVMLTELFDALEAFDKDENVGAMVVTGNEKAFAAGADIKEMAEGTVGPNPRDSKNCHRGSLRLGLGRWMRIRHLVRHDRCI
jgi:enoyl-CoA hydratase/carnithine racemase